MTQTPERSKRVDALRAVAESSLAAGPTGSSSADRWQMVVHADADDPAAASDGQPADAHNGDDYDDGCTTSVPAAPVDPYSRPPLGQVEGGPTIPNPVLLHLAFDATLRGMVDLTKRGRHGFTLRSTQSVP